MQAIRTSRRCRRVTVDTAARGSGFCSRYRWPSMRRARSGAGFARAAGLAAAKIGRDARPSSQSFRHVLVLFASAFLLGLIFNAAPGAVFAETVRQGVRGGFRPALAVPLGSLAGDALWAAARAGRRRIACTSGSCAGAGRHRWGTLPAVAVLRRVARGARRTGQAVAGWAALVARVLRGAADRWARLNYRACAVAFLLLALSSLRELCGTWPQRAQPAAAFEQRNG